MTAPHQKRRPAAFAALIAFSLAGAFAAIHGDPLDRFTGPDFESSVALDSAAAGIPTLAGVGTAFPGPADAPKIGELQALPSLDSHPEILLRDAFRAEIAGDNRQALESYAAFFEKGEDSAHARAAYGRLLAVNRRFDDALRELDRAIELAPPAAGSEYAILKGEVLRRAKRDGDARDFLKQARFRYEDDPGIEFLLGEIYYDARDYPLAWQHHKRTLVHLDRAGSRAATYRSISLWRLADLNLRANKLERAGQYLEQYLRHNPRRHYPRYILADRVYYRLGRYEDSRRELENLLRNDEVDLAEQSVDLARGYGLLARIYYLFQDVRFIPTLRLHSAYKKDNQPGIVERSLFLAHRGDEREALRILLPIVKRQENTVFIPWVAILRIVEKSGRPELIADQLTHVASIAEGFGRHRMAFRWLHDASAIKASAPKVPVSETRINQVFAAHYEATGQNYRASLYLDRAIRAAEAAHSARTESKKDAGDSADSTAPDTPESAADEFEEDLQDVIARLKLTRASILAKSDVGQYDLAAALAREVGESALAHATRGEIEYSRGDLAAAEAAYTRAIELVPIEAARQQKNPRVREVLGVGRRSRSSYYFMRAAVRYDRGAVAEAVADLEQSLELNPKFAIAANFLAYLYARENQKLLTAFRLVDEAIESDPVNGHYLDTLAWIHFRRGEYPKARYHASYAVRLLEYEGETFSSGAKTGGEKNSGVEPEMLAHLGDILTALARPTEAGRNYRRARALLKQRQSLRDDSGRARNFGLHDRKLLERLEGLLGASQSDSSTTTQPAD
ncbi:MAG: tetratricopeptide repeat protein [bacterium]|nr:tetratricopeptide repeat protein [bacterium]